MDTQLQRETPAPQRVLGVVNGSGTEQTVVDSARHVLDWASGGRLTVLLVASECRTEPTLLLETTRAALGEKGLAAMGVQLLLRWGDSVDQALAQAEREQPQLIVTCDGGVSTQRLLRRSPCSLLVLPGRDARHTTITDTGRILVPVDFSPESREAALFALQLASARGRHAGTVELTHVYPAGVGHHKMGWTYEQFCAKVRAAAEERMGDFVSRLKQSVINGAASGLRAECHQGNHAAKTILDLAEQTGCSQMVLGSRARSAMAGLLLPSVTERVVLSARVPVWVVRSGFPFLGLMEGAWFR